MLRGPVFSVAPSFEASISNSSIVSKQKYSPLVLELAEKVSESKAEGFGVESSGDR